MRTEIYRKHKHDRRNPRILHRGSISIIRSYGRNTELKINLKETTLDAGLNLQVLRGEILNFLQNAGYTFNIEDIHISKGVQSRRNREATLEVI